MYKTKRSLNESARKYKEHEVDLKFFRLKNKTRLNRAPIVPKTTIGSCV